MKVIKVQTLDIELPENTQFGKALIQINDSPIKDDFDLWRAIDAAESQMDRVIAETNKYKYIRESQRKANRTIFENLKKLIMDYAKVKNDL